MSKGQRDKTRIKRKEREAPGKTGDEVIAENMGETVKKRSGGAFQTMGLLQSLVKATQRKGFRLPTPIQRKCIPPLLEGKDVVGMARTGSGKTAAFVLPMLQALKCHSIKVGIRGLILSPSRELALQTFGVIKELSKFTDLRSIVLVGGDSVEEQFVQLATNPDIVVATPGRLMHICIESRLGLKEVQFVVWDEADRLMEDFTMAEQMKEISSRLPETRQTALFSATLPKALAEFAQVGLRNPLLIRLDVENKLSPDLHLSFIQVKSEFKDAALLLLLNKIISGESQLTVIFTATKHHVEYLQELLTAFNFPCSYIYGALDQSARRLAIEQFRAGKRPILVVTDVAARGIDIPLLDNVINYDFPSTSKLFVHRVGRVARAGRSGRAFSLLSFDETPYLFDLQLFLGKTMVPAASLPKDDPKVICLGEAPQTLLDEEQESIVKKSSTIAALESLRGVMKNANKLYRKTRPTASPESHRRSKEFAELNSSLGVHPVFDFLIEHKVRQQASIVHAIHQFKPKSSHLSFIRPSINPNKPRNSLVSSVTEQPTKYAASKDELHYLNYTKVGTNDESGYSIASGASFSEQARRAVFDLSTSRADDPSLLRKRRHGREDDQRKKLIRTEFGTKVSRSFRTDLYDKWRVKTHLDIQRPGELESEVASKRARAILSSTDEQKKWRNSKKLGKRKHNTNNRNAGNNIKRVK